MEKKAYSKKRSATKKIIDEVFIESFRLSPDAELTVKEVCKKASINRSTFYAYYRDAADMREQIESSLIEQFENKIAPVIDRHLDDSAMITSEIMKFNRENGYLPMLLISAGSSNFVYKISRAVTEMIATNRVLKDFDREKMTMLLTYHFAGMSMVMRQMKEIGAISNEDYESIAQSLIELILPVVKNGLLTTLKDL